MPSLKPLMRPSLPGQSHKRRRRNRSPRRPKHRQRALAASLGLGAWETWISCGHCLAKQLQQAVRLHHPQPSPLPPLLLPPLAPPVSLPRANLGPLPERSNKDSSSKVAVSMRTWMRSYRKPFGCRWRRRSAATRVTAVAKEMAAVAVAVAVEIQGVAKGVAGANSSKAREHRKLDSFHQPIAALYFCSRLSLHPIINLPSI